MTNTNMNQEQNPVVESAKILIGKLDKNAATLVVGTVAVGVIFCKGFKILLEHESKNTSPNA